MMNRFTAWIARLAFRLARSWRQTRQSWRKKRPIEMKASGLATTGRTATITSKGANMLVCVSSDPGYLPRDSEQNTWHAIPGNPGVSLHYAMNPRTSRTHTFYPPEKAGAVLQVAAYSGVAGPPEIPVAPGVVATKDGLITGMPTEPGTFGPITITGPSVMPAHTCALCGRVDLTLNAGFACIGSLEFCPSHSQQECRQAYNARFPNGEPE